MDEDCGEEAALRQAAWEVYGVAPPDFVATRTRWVKELRSRTQRAAAKSVAALRKPSVSAAAVNALVRAQDPVAGQLRDLGTRLRHAQSALDAEGLAALRGERDEVLRAWVAAARQHATGTLAATAESEVRDTAVAALADGAAAEVVLSGTLTRALSYSGFGEVDVSDAVARTSTGVVLTRIEGGGATETSDPQSIDDEADEAEDEPEHAEPEDDEPEDDEQEDDEQADEAEKEGQEDLEPEDGDTQDLAPEDEPEEDEGDLSREVDVDDDEDLDGDEGGEDVAADPDADGLAQLTEALAEAEEQVTVARRARRTALDAAEAAAVRAEQAAAGLAEARRLLGQAEKEADSARAADEQAFAAVEHADGALAAARERRARARAALEEAEDAG